MPLSRTTGVAVAGHFGEFLQGRLGPQGPLALVTVPCAALSVTLEARAARTARLHDPMRLLPVGALARVQRALGRPLRGAVRLHGTMVAGAGCGASTAALIALIRHMVPDLPAERVMRLCWRIEGASDPLAYEDPACHLWGSRCGDSLGGLPALPAMRIIGGLWGTPEATRPDDLRFADISDLVPLWRRACLRGDLAGCAQLAAQSAGRTTALRGPCEDPTQRLAQETGALGWLRAHTGSARGLIVPPDMPRATRLQIHDRLRAEGYGRVMEFTFGLRRAA